MTRTRGSLSALRPDRGLFKTDEDSRAAFVRVGYSLSYYFSLAHQNGANGFPRGLRLCAHAITVFPHICSTLFMISFKASSHLGKLKQNISSFTDEEPVREMLYSCRPPRPPERPLEHGTKGISFPNKRGQWFS